MRIIARVFAIVLLAGLLEGPLAHAAQAQRPKDTAYLSGRVTRADTGAPMEKAIVLLVNLSSAPAPLATSSDASGQFEFSNVPSGDYTLSAQATGWIGADATRTRPSGGKTITLLAGQRVDKFELVVARTSTIDGRVLDQSGAPMAGVPMSVGQVRPVGSKPLFVPRTESNPQRSDSDGRFRFVDLVPGDYYVLATAGPFGPAAPSGSSTSTPDKLLPYLPTYWPGTDRLAGARPVRIELGVDATNLSFQLTPATLVTVSGHVRERDGRTVSEAQVLLIPTEGGALAAAIAAPTFSDVDGKFVYPAVPAGTYMLQSFSRTGFGTRAVAIPAAQDEVTGLDVTVRYPVSARGHMTFEGGPPPAIDTVAALFMPTDYLSGPVGSNALVAKPKPDWTFEMTGLAWIGLMRARLPAGWALKSVLRDGRDVADEPTDFQTADVNGLELVITNRLASIKGTVIDGSKPVGSARVLLMRDDRATASLPPRSPAGAMTKPDGSFTIAGLLPGRYRIIAVDALDLGPDWARDLYASATPVTVSADESKTMELRFVKR